jgi:hypothetical protein
MAHEGEMLPKHPIARRVLMGTAWVLLGAVVIGPSGVASVGRLIDRRDFGVWEQGVFDDIRLIKLDWLEDVIIDDFPGAASFITNGTPEPDHTNWGQAVILDAQGQELDAGIRQGGREALALMDPEVGEWRVGVPAAGSHFTRVDNNNVEVALSLNPVGVTAGIGYVLGHKFNALYNKGTGPVDLESLTPQGKDPLAFVEY